MTSAEWADVFRVNVDATFACLQAAARSMRQRSQGAIVNTCSLSALCPAVRQSHYDSSKAAVLALTRSAAVELAPRGVRVNPVPSGLIERYGIEQDWPDGVARWLERAPLARVGSPTDVAGAYPFLVLSLASWITGQNLIVDGGITASPAY